MDQGLDTATEQTLLDQVTAYLAAPAWPDDSSASRSAAATFVLEDRHTPAATAGEHTLRAQLTVQGAGIPQQTTMGLSYAFAVAGLPERLADQAVAQVFPAPDSSGAWGHVLPHIALHRSTLPWEAETEGRPWLALVVLPGRTPERASVAVAGTLLAGMRWELAAHVRRDDKGAVAIVHGSQVAVAGWQTAFLVDMRSAKSDSDTSMLPVLYQWSYFNTAADSVAASPLQGLSVGTLRAAHAGQPYEKGFWPLPHYMRRGTATRSWYRGPLVPQKTVRAWQPQLWNSADALLRYDAEHQMLDASYAAAWELGRLLTLASPKVAKVLYHHKRALALRHKVQPVAFSPYQTEADVADLPSVVREWINALLTLEAIPLPYLVPDVQLLPAHSLRVAYINEGWLQALVDGALSLGRVAVTPKRQTQALALRRMAVLVRIPALGTTIEGVTVTGDGRAPLAQRVLGGDTLLCVWDKPISTVKLFASPLELGTYAMEATEAGWGVFAKTERGARTETWQGVSITENGVIDWSAIGNNAAAVGLALLSSAGEVTYHVASQAQG